MSVYIQAIERAIERRVNETLDAEFQRGVERGKFEQRRTENAELADLRAKLAAAEAQLREAKIAKDVAETIAHTLAHPDKSPCGHCESLAHTEDGGKTIHCYVCQLAAATEREAGLAALVERLREGIDRIMIGGNHLASALIGMLGAGNDTFPPYSTDYEEASKVIADPNNRDLWMCWKIIMLQRDALALLTPPAALEALRRREREAALREAANLIQQTTPDATDDEFSKGKYDGRTYAIEQLESMADAIAAERDKWA